MQREVTRIEQAHDMFDDAAIRPTHEPPRSQKRRAQSDAGEFGILGAKARNLGPFLARSGDEAGCSQRGRQGPVKKPFGQHRLEISPVRHAAALDRDDAPPVLKLAGTIDRYEGCIRQIEPVSKFLVVDPRNPQQPRFDGRLRV